MDRNEVNQLFLLLRQFYPKAPATTDKMKAWLLALEPYDYADVRETTLEYARSHKYPPDLYDVVPKVGAKKRLSQMEKDAVARLMGGA